MTTARLQQADVVNGSLTFSRTSEGSTLATHDANSAEQPRRVVPSSRNIKRSASSHEIMCGA